MVTRAPRQRHDGPRGILTRRADVARAVYDKQVPDVVRLLKLVQHRRLGIVAHPRGAQLVDGPSRSQHLAIDAHHLDPGSLEHLAPRRNHVLGPLPLVVAELVVKAQDRDAPAVLRRGIQVDVALVAGQDLPEGTHADERPRVIPHRLLELGAESRRLEGVLREHGMTARALEAVAPEEPRLAVLQVAEPGDVEPSWAAIVEGV